MPSKKEKPKYKLQHLFEEGRKLVVEEHDLTAYHGGLFEDLQEYARKLKNDTVYLEDLRFDIEYEGYETSYPVLTVRRWESDEEFEKRKQKEKKARIARKKRQQENLKKLRKIEADDSVRDKEIAELERLKKKYSKF